MIRILLIRHGTTDLLGRVLYGRMPGVCLSQTGLDEARALAAALKERYDIQEVVSSPLERAQRTAQFLAESQDLSITIDEGLNEIDFGEWMGLSFDELANLQLWHQYNYSRSITHPPGGESMMEVQARAWKALLGVFERHNVHETRTVAVVSHGDVIRVLLILLLGMSLDHIHRLEIAPASVSEVWI
jgi:probable phosphoglycerate mutase